MSSEEPSEELPQQLSEEPTEARMLPDTRQHGPMEKRKVSVCLKQSAVQLPFSRPNSDNYVHFMQ